MSALSRDATVPGCLDVRVFDQNRIWIDAVRVRHVIADPTDMTDDWFRVRLMFRRSS
jgi:hypothetical protein